MLKGRPVLPSLNSLMAFVALGSLGSFWGERSGEGRDASPGPIAHLLEFWEELGHDGRGEGWGGVKAAGRWVVLY